MFTPVVHTTTKFGDIARPVLVINSGAAFLYGRAKAETLGNDDAVPRIHFLIGPYQSLLAYQR